jgi:hypothetical protein
VLKVKIIRHVKGHGYTTTWHVYQQIVRVGSENWTATDEKWQSVKKKPVPGLVSPCLHTYV